MKKLFLSFLAALLFLPCSVQAASFETGNILYLDKNLADDLYAFGEQVSILSRIDGDLITAGGKVIFDGTISEDLTMAGGDVLLSGTVQDDVRIAGGNVRVDANIQGDLLAAAGSISIDTNSEVDGDVYLAAGDVLINGDINGDLRIAGGGESHLHLNGRIKGSAVILGFQNISFGSNARIEENLYYKSIQETEIPQGVVKGKVTFKEISVSNVKKSVPGILAGFSLFSFLSTLFFGLILIWIFRYYLLHSIAQAHETPFRSLGIGFLILVLTPLAFIILLITTIGIPLAFILILLWAILLFVGKIMASMLIGFKVVKVNATSKFGRLFGSFALGAVIYTLISLVPIIGWMINFIFILITVGGLIIYAHETFTLLRKKKLA